MVVLNEQRTDELALGKSGRDHFSKHKALTVVMIPYERFSPFAKAVDELYKNIQIPFNLIVVEGNAPECIRVALEKRQRQHRNITIVYSRHRPSITGAINLAIPHVKTKYAFIMDNDVRLPAGSVRTLIGSAERNGAEMVVPKNCLVEREVASEESAEKHEEIKSLGIRSCFLISSSAIQKLGRLDEEVSPFTAGADITLLAKQKGVRIIADSDAYLESSVDERLKSFDTDLYSFQWNALRTSTALKHFKEKWGMELLDPQYRLWLEEKRKKVENLRKPQLNELVSSLGNAFSAAGKSAAGILAHVSGARVRQ